MTDRPYAVCPACSRPMQRERPDEPELRILYTCPACGCRVELKPEKPS